MIHRIDGTRLSAFRSRLKHLQRIGFPPGVNTGKGRAAEYGFTETLLIGLALELIQLGLNPERAAGLLSESRDLVLAEARAAARQPNADVFTRRLMFVDPRTMSTLQNSIAANDDNMMFGHSDDLAKRFAGGGGVVPRLSVIDFRGLIILIAAAATEEGFTTEDEVTTDLAAWALQKRK